MHGATYEARFLDRKVDAAGGGEMILVEWTGRWLKETEWVPARDVHFTTQQRGLRSTRRAEGGAQE